MKEKSVFRQLLALLQRISIKPYYFIVPIVLSGLAALFEGLSLSLLIPLLNGFFAMDYSFIKTTPVLGSVVSFLPDSVLNSDRRLFILLLAIFSSVIILKNVFRYSSVIGMTYLSTRALHHLRKHVFDEYMDFGKEYFDRTTVGYHSTLMSQFTTNAFAPLTIIDKFVAAMFSLIAYFGIMLFISWQLTLFAIPFFLLLHFAVRFMIRDIQAMSRRIAENTGELGKKVVEILSVIPLVKVSNTRLREFRTYTEISDKASRLEFRKVAIQRLTNPIQEILTLGAILIIFAFMSFLVVNDQAAAGATSFIVYFYVIVNASGKFALLTSARGDMVAHAGALEEVMNVFDGADKEYVAEGKESFPGLREEIAFKDLRFSYKNGKDVLHDLTFSVKKGGMTALVGPTGAGKTTIISLILRYYDCPRGTLLLDGRDIRDFKIASLYDHMAVVSQETLLLHESLRYNIAYGQPDATEAQIGEAVKKARLEELVERLPDGLDTLVGDRGVKLSGGEKQRVSIARALLKNADILILDEATSSLDSKTEHLIQEAMDDAMRDRTAIVIAHRLSTIKSADNIVVLENGTCVQQGTLEELTAKKGLFQELWDQQKFV